MHDVIARACPACEAPPRSVLSRVIRVWLRVARCKHPRRLWRPRDVRWLSMIVALRGFLAFRVALLVPLAVLTFSAFGCSTERSEGAAGTRRASLTERTVTLSSPKDVSLMSVALGARSGIQLGPSSRVERSSTDGATVIHLESGTFRAQPDVLLNDVWSKTAVTLGNRTHVRGRVYAPNVNSGVNTVIDGGVVTNAAFEPLNTLSWQVHYPDEAATPIDLKPGKLQFAAPGRYGRVRVAPRSTLTLRSGTYFIDELELEPDATLSLQQQTGPVVLYVSTTLGYKGHFRVEGAGSPDVALVYLGSRDVHIHTPFDGAFVAPDAHVTLHSVKTRHEGFFYARQLTVGPHTTVKHRAPLVLLTVPGLGPQRCADWIPLRTDLTGKERELAYQRAINRFCSMPGASDCRADIAARTNVDFTAVAFALMGEQITPAQYLAVVRDRTRKEHAAEDDPGVARAICNSSDDDGDLIPTPRDRCPNTPALTPTFDDGCTDTSLPPAPPPEHVQELFRRGGVLIDPRCSGAKLMPKIVAGAFYRPANPAAGTYILSGRVTNQPVGCPVWYFYDIEEYTHTGPVRRYQVAFREQEEMTSLVGLAKPVPGGFIQFNPLPTDDGTRRLLGTAGGRVGVRFRVRAMNGGGMRSDWSAWKVTNYSDCLNLGFQCG